MNLRQGWTPEKIPMILSGSCVDFEKMKAAGDLAKGVYFIGTGGASILNPDAITNPRYKAEALAYLSKAAQYGASDADIKKGFGTQGWAVMMTIWPA